MSVGTYKNETINELINANEFLIIVGNSYSAYIDNTVGLYTVSSNINYPYAGNYGYRFAISIDKKGLVQVYTEFIGELVKTITIDKIYYR